MNDVLHTIEIDSLAYGGAGIGRLDGKAVFVQKAYPGDTVLVRIEKDKKRHAEASLVRIVEASPDRVAPPCSYWKDCGGCPWMGLSYPAQLKWKRIIAQESLKRIGGADASVSDTVPSDLELEYRSRIRVKVSIAEGSIRLGYHRPRSNDFISVDKCLIANSRVNSILSEALEKLNSNAQDWTALKEIEIESGDEDEAGRMTLYLKTPVKKNLAEALLSSMKNTKGLVFRWGKNKEVFGDTSLKSRLAGGIQVSYGAGVFSQVNSGQNIKMSEKLIELTGLGLEKSGLDLFCGMGNYTIPIAASGAAMTGVESNGQAVSDAEENSARLKVFTAGFSKGDVGEMVKGMVKSGLGFDSVILNPPRGGMRDVENAAKLARENIVYVSCDPPALARDTYRLARAGFDIESVIPFDMFPQTSHVEVLCLFKRP